MRLRRIRRLFRTRRRKTIAIVLLLAAALSGYFYFTRPDKDADQPDPITYHSQLTGKKVSREISERPILGIMIENSEEARPQTGLSSAGIVFEATTEGGITRYLALFQEDMPKEVGPARSVRPHFVSWVSSLDASVAHVGGSADGLSLIEQLNTKSLSQFKYDGPYSRVQTRQAPHNMYASTDKLRELQKELKQQKSKFSEFPRSNDSPAAEPKASNIILDFSHPEFKAEFRYDKATNSYIRYLTSEKHIDAETNKPISVKNLIVLKMAINGSNIQALGSGEALVFKDGGVQEVRWTMTSAKERFKFLNESGQEIELNRGNTWIAALAKEKKVNYK